MALLLLESPGEIDSDHLVGLLEALTVYLGRYGETRWSAVVRMGAR